MTIMSSQHHLKHLMKRGTDFLGTEFAIMGGAMTWVSESNLVSAISEAGGFGVLACGSMAANLLEDQIGQTYEKTQKPFGVNLITLHPDLDKLIEVCIRNNVSHVVLAGGIPNREAIKKIKDAGVKLLCFAPALPLAKKLIQLGVDALIIEGSEAGGHIGPVSTSVLAQEILPVITQVPIFAAGGIATGDGILMYLDMGASGVQLGTKFVCAHECQAHEKFKKAFIRAASRHATTSTSIDPRLPVIPVRALENKGSKDFIAFQRDMIKKLDDGVLSTPEAQLKVEHYWAGALRRAVVDGDIENGSLMAGQCVGLVRKEQSVQDIIQEIITEAINSLDKKTQL